MPRRGKGGRPAGPYAGTHRGFHQRLGRRLRRRRRALKLSLVEAAGRCALVTPINVQTWSEYERGLSGFNLVKFLAMCLALKISPARLLGKQLWRALAGHDLERAARVVNRESSDVREA